jgi:hypothetical protein
VLENRVLRKIFGPKRNKVTQEWRRLQNELYGLYSSPIIIPVIRSKGMNGWGRWHIWETCTQGFGGQTQWERYHMQDLGIDGKIILKWIFKTWDGEACSSRVLFQMACLRLKQYLPLAH